MNWWLVARWQAIDAYRSRGLLVTLGLFAAIASAAVLIPARAVDGGLSAEQVLVFLVAPLRLLVALTAMLAGYHTVAGPRAGGQLRLLLGLPVERRAWVLGAFVGRSALVIGGVIVGLLSAGLSLHVSFGRVPVMALLSLAGLLALLAIAMTALAIGLSAATAAPGRAAVGVVAAFVAFEFFWGVLPAGVHYLLVGSLPGATVPAWVVLLERLQPFGAFEVASELVLPAPDTGIQLSAAGAESTAATGPSTLADRVAGPVPEYLDPRGSVVVLFGWVLLPLTVGWYRFRRADL